MVMLQPDGKKDEMSYEKNERQQRSEMQKDKAESITLMCIREKSKNDNFLTATH